MAAASYFEVVGVVGRCDFNASGTLVKLSVFVGYDGNTSANEGERNVLTDEVFVAFVVRVYCNRGVAEQGFGTCGGNLNITAAANQRITDVPEVAVLFALVNLGVGD